MSTKTKTIDITPTWEEICRIIRVGLTNGTTEGRQKAIETMLDMARRADALVEVNEYLPKEQQERVEKILTGGRRQFMKD